MKATLRIVAALLFLEVVALQGPSVAQLPSPPPGRAFAAASPEPFLHIFDRANELFQKGRFEDAAEGYRKVVAGGTDDATVWYDLGNAYVRLDDIGRARACYERALRLSPRDGDVRANLSALSEKLVDKETDEDPLLHYARCFSMNELAVATSVCWFATAFLFATSLRQRKEALGWLTVVSFGLLLCCGGLLGLRWHSDAPGRQAIVIPAEIKLYNGPGRDYTASISLHAGTRVQVLKREGDWREIGAFNRVRGWLRAEQVEVI